MYVCVLVHNRSCVYVSVCARAHARALTRGMHNYTFMRVYLSVCECLYIGIAIGPLANHSLLFHALPHLHLFVQVEELLHVVRVLRLAERVEQLLQLRPVLADVDEASVDEGLLVPDLLLQRVRQRLLSLLQQEAILDERLLDLAAEHPLLDVQALGGVGQGVRAGLHALQRLPALLFDLRREEEFQRLQERVRETQGLNNGRGGG